METNQNQKLVAHLEGTNLVTQKTLRMILLRNKVISLGRNSKSSDQQRVIQYVLSDISVSSIHCYAWNTQFDDNTPAICYLKDVSTNHTYVNNKPIKNGEYVILNHNDDVKILNGFKGIFKLAAKQLNLIQSTHGLYEGKIKDWGGHANGFRLRFIWESSSCIQRR